jgi:hypothetical protein
MVQTAVRKLPIGDPKSPEAMALWYAVVAQFDIGRLGRQNFRLGPPQAVILLVSVLIGVGCPRSAS